MNKSDQQLLLTLYAQMKRRGHRLPTPIELKKKEGMWLYEKCKNCNLSIYNYSQLDSPVCNK